MPDFETKLHRQLRNTGLFQYRFPFDYMVEDLASSLGYPHLKEFTIELKAAAQVLDRVLQRGRFGADLATEIAITGGRLARVKNEGVTLAKECFSAFGSTGWNAEYLVRRVRTGRKQSSVYTVGIAYGHQREHHAQSTFEPGSGKIITLFGGNVSLREEPYNNFFADNPLVAAQLVRSFAETCQAFVAERRLVRAV